MKTFISTLLFFILLSPAWASQPAESPLTVGAQTTLSAATHYLDAVFVNTLASLKLIASTPEAKNGDWKGIKPYLNQLASAVPGVYFFVLPDGNYYSVEKDYTNFNLSNRGYFGSLFAGNQVKGFPIYSRSTGKKSALVAFPIVVDKKVIGALGASIFLDKLHAELNRAFALPQGYTWFVLNSAGNTMLDRDSDFIFMNALTQGSMSLKDAISEALKHEKGAMGYELGGIIRNADYRKLPTMDWWMILAKIEGKEIQTPAPLNLSLERFVPDLQERLNEIDASLAALIEKSKVNVKEENEIRKLLHSIITENPAVVNAAFVDPSGVMRNIEPREYKNFENVDISAQKHVSAMQKKPMPVFSDGFMSAEGFLAMSLARPLYDKKKFAGSISLLIRPELLVRPLLKTSTIPNDYELWIMQTDGMIIYEEDQEEIGRMLFSDPLYAEHESLIKLGRTMVSTPTGKGSYMFLAPGLKGKVIKHAVWDTVRLHDKEWRVVLAYRPYE